MADTHSHLETTTIPSKLNSFCSAFVRRTYDAEGARLLRSISPERETPRIKNSYYTVSFGCYIRNLKKKKERKNIKTKQMVDLD